MWYSLHLMRAVVFTGAGGSEVIRLEDRPDPTPGSDEVVLAVRYAGLNPADLAQLAGNYPAPPGSPPDIPGIEVAGTVVARGANARRFEEGARVFGLVGGGGFADRVVVNERHLAPVPDNVDDAGAAAVPESFITAHDAVMTQAGLRLGETLLVNGANGGVGTAAVQLASAAGARVFANARARDLHPRLAELGAEAVTPDNFVERAKAAGGADVVLELVGAPNIEGSFDALKVKGRYVIVGTGAGGEVELQLRWLMGKRARLMGTVLRARPLEEKAAAVQAFAHEVVPLLASGRVKPLVDRIFPADQASDALDYMRGAGKFGNVLIEF
jgi:NADPH:quinone reductase-like Zn-dependent oxidoreductase